MTWVIGRIDIVDPEWPLAVHLKDGVASGPGIMLHVGRHAGKPTGSDLRSFRVIESVTHAKGHRPRNHRDILCRGVSVRRDFVTRRHFQTDGVNAYFGRIALQDRKLRPGREARRRLSPLDVCHVEQDMLFLHGGTFLRRFFGGQDGHDPEASQQYK